MYCSCIFTYTTDLWQLWQYPSLHVVTQTDGGGDTSFAPGIYGLDPNSVPTFGDYLSTADYDTFWKGTTIKTEPVLDEFEMYNLSIDPIESRNLANPAYATDKSTAIEVIMAKILDEQSQKKRLYPSNVNESSSQNHNTGFLNL